MKLKTIIFLTTILLASFAKAQKIDSICFHLYTDSLKKGVHNYINVDGQLADGKWLPLTSKDIQFSSSGGKFEGNDLVLPPDFAEEKVVVTATLKSNSNASKEITIWIKKKPDDEILPTKNDVLNSKTSKPRSRKNP
ncbi:MAG: hypothetical protein ABUT20_13290 [Bacteroidota bacterium]